MKLRDVLLDVLFLPLILFMYLVLGILLLVYPGLLDEADGNSVDPEDWQL